MIKFGSSFTHQSDQSWWMLNLLLAVRIQQVSHLRQHIHRVDAILPSRNRQVIIDERLGVGPCAETSFHQQLSPWWYINQAQYALLISVWKSVPGSPGNLQPFTRSCSWNADLHHLFCSFFRLRLNRELSMEEWSARQKTPRSSLSAFDLCADRYHRQFTSTSVISLHIWDVLSKKNPPTERCTAAVEKSDEIDEDPLQFLTLLE